MGSVFHPPRGPNESLHLFIFSNYQKPSQHENEERGIYICWTRKEDCAQAVVLKLVFEL